MKLITTIALACVAAGAEWAAAEPPVAQPPNVVFLLADDLGWTGPRCFGSDLYETPNLDRLAAGGMKFTQAYAACTVCSPTRAAIMTGIFTSDNGGLTQRNGKHDRFTENLPLRRGKGSAYEGGVRVPLIVSGPGVDTAGSVCEQPVISMDFYPTILEVTGASGDAEHNRALDGVSLTRWLKDPQSKLDRNLYWHYPHYHAGGDSPYSAVRSGRWRLVEFHEDQRLELFDLRTDPGETTNLADANPGQRNQLRDQLHAWRKSVDAQMPTTIGPE